MKKDTLSIVGVAADTTFPEIIFTSEDKFKTYHLCISRGHGMTMQHESYFHDTNGIEDKESWGEVIRIDELFKLDEVSGEVEVDTFYLRSVLALIMMSDQHRFGISFNISFSEGSDWIIKVIDLLNAWYKNGRR